MGHLTADKRRHLNCACCGAYAGQWQQFYNQDTGWGLCAKCRDWIWNRPGEQLEFTRTYGLPGVNYEAWPAGHPGTLPIYVVMDEHTLGHVNADVATGSMGVLSATVDGHDWKNGPVHIGQSGLRRATAADFERFRVQLPPDFKPWPQQSITTKATQ